MTAPRVAPTPTPAAAPVSKPPLSLLLLASPLLDTLPVLAAATEAAAPLAVVAEAEAAAPVVVTEPLKPVVVKAEMTWVENVLLVSTVMPALVIVVTRVFTIVNALGVCVDADIVFGCRSWIESAASMDGRAGETCIAIHLDGRARKSHDGIESFSTAEA